LVLLNKYWSVKITFRFSFLKWISETQKEVSENIFQNVNLASGKSFPVCRIDFWIFFFQKHILENIFRKPNLYFGNFFSEAKFDFLKLFSEHHFSYFQPFWISSNKLNEICTHIHKINKKHSSSLTHTITTRRNLGQTTICHAATELGTLTHGTTSFLLIICQR